MPDIVVAYCGVCDNARYRSKKPLGKDDRPSPADFDVAHPEQAPPETFDARTPLACSTCGGSLKFIPAAALGKREGPADRTARAAVPRAAESVETLFSVAADEAIKDMRETPSGLVIITSKRIVRLQL